jgi:methionyl-tRNA formyltransferase
MYIPKEILDIPTYGSINIHFAALPKYRGANPIQWAIINGEIENGITIHYMNEKIDSGNIISQRLVPIEFTDTWIDVIFKCFKSCDEMLYTDINDILNIKNKSIPQDESIATTYHRRTPEDGEFELNDTPIKIYNKIRALVHPLPGAFFYDENKYKHIINRFIPLEKVINKSYTT